jgi:tetratricopeptide (TPR) repeat protein
MSRPLRGLFVALALVQSFAGESIARTRSAPEVRGSAEVADSLSGNYLAAIIAGATRDTGASASYFREALKRDPRSDELTERAFVTLLADGAIPDAARLAERVLRRDPGNTLAQLVLGVQALKAQQFERARGFLMKGGRGREADVTATLLNAWSLLGSGQTRRAIDTVDRLKGEDSFSVFRDLHAGLIADLGGRPEEAATRFAAAYQADKRTLRLVDIYGRFLARSGDIDGAVRVFQDFDKLAPRNPVVIEALRGLRAGEKPLRTVASPTQGAAEVLYSLGAVGNREGDEIASLVYLRLALWLEPAHDLALITLADTYDRLKQFEAANTLYADVPKASPMYRSAQIQIGVNLEQLEKSEQAVAHLEALAKELPDDTEALSTLGNIYRSRKDFAKAAEAYSKAIVSIGTPDAGYWSLYYFRGIAYERTKQWDKAEADLKKALALQPNQPLVLNYLGYSWVDQGINLDEAFTMLRKAVEQRPRDGYIVDSLGWAYYRLGRYEEAVRFLERAVELRASDPVINDHLGDAYWQTGRKIEAGFQWNHARDLKPEPEDLDKILDKIRNGMAEIKPTDKPVPNLPTDPPSDATTTESGNAVAPKGNGG